MAQLLVIYEPNIMVQQIKKLPALTSLRFFAAAIVVNGHCLNMFSSVMPGLTEKVGPYLLELYQGVSFFFVLSGFILAYAYPDFIFSPRLNVKKFWLARVARIWPAHIFATTFFIFFIVFPISQPSFNQMLFGVFIFAGVIFLYRYPGLFRFRPYLVGLISLGLFFTFLHVCRHFLFKLFCNVAMIHAWIPDSNYYYFINAPSWSISTEFFFYLCFPLLMYRLQSTWFLKLVIAVGLLASVFYICHLGHYPFTSIAPDQHALVYISPLSRLFEFALGVVLVLLYNKWKENAFSLFWISVAEITILLCDVLSMHLDGVLSSQLEPYIGFAIADWLRYSGSCFFFAATILIFSLQRGIVSKFLSRSFFVLLGEISYVIYLMHINILLVIKLYYPTWLTNFNFFTLLGLFWLICLVVSYAIWRYFERPMRSFIKNLPMKLRKSNTDGIVPVNVYQNS